jgi:hypothetical protein
MVSVEVYSDKQYHAYNVVYHRFKIPTSGNFFLAKT